MTDTSKFRIMCLEDMPSDAELQRAALQRDGMEVDWLCVNNEADFIRGIAEFGPDVILSDYNLPSYDGTSAVEYIQSHHPQIPVIIVTGALGEIKAVQLMKKGAVDYILKDRLARLPEAVRHAVSNARLSAQGKLAEQKIIQRDRQIKNSLIDFVGSLASIVEMRDQYTAGHQRRVADLAVAIAQEMNMSEQQIEGIRLGGMIHDIGKMRVPAEILSKPGRLSDLEYKMIQQHAEAGYDILKGGDFPWPIAQMVYQHHERMDGSGYPRGLKGADILMEARILAVADVVEAIASHRPYRPGLGNDAALAEISRGRGVIYEPAAVDACIKLFRERQYAFST